MRILITLLLLVFMLMLMFGAPQGTPPAGAPAPTGSIEGVVVRASNSAPISGVQIALVSMTPVAPATSTTATPSPLPAGAVAIQILRAADGTQIVQTPDGTQLARLAPGAQIPDGLLASLRNAAGAQPQATVLTDSDGRFTFRNVAVGTYTIRAQRPGYFGPMAPQGSYAGSIQKQIKVEADKTARVDLAMVQGGVLRGLLRDPDGQPAANYAIVTARPGYTSVGRAIWSFNGAMNSDDRGEFRWTNLPPGEYYVGSGPRAPGPIANIQDSWARVFYPGVIDPNQARSVTVTEGGETTVNLDAIVKPWGAFKISGVALNPLPNLPTDAATGVINRGVTSLVLMPLDLTPLDNPPTTSWTNLVATSTKPGGEFQLTNVDPGRYELYAMVNDTQNRRIWSGHMRVEVKDKDISGLNITVSPGVTLRGEVVINGPAGVRPEAVRIQLLALDTLPREIGMIVGSVPVDEAGKFQIANLSEGRYRMSVTVPSPNAYVASIQQGGANIYDEGFSVDTQSGESPVRIEVNTAGEKIEGNVRVSSLKDAPNAMVVLVPSAPHRNNPVFYKTTVADDKGHYSISGVAPGSYSLFAWDSVLPSAWLNAEFLQKYEGRGKSLSVQVASRNDVDLELVQNK